MTVSKVRLYLNESRNDFHGGQIRFHLSRFVKRTFFPVYCQARCSAEAEARVGVTSASRANTREQREGAAVHGVFMASSEQSPFCCLVWSRVLPSRHSLTGPHSWCLSSGLSELGESACRLKFDTPVSYSMVS